MNMCENSHFSLSNSTYFSQFVVVSWVRKYSPAVPEFHIAFMIVWLDGCIIVDIVCFHPIFSLTSFSHAKCAPQAVVLAIHLRMKPYRHCSAVQFSYFMVKSKHLNFIVVVRYGLQAGLCDFRLRSLLRCHEMVIRLTFKSGASKPELLKFQVIHVVHTSLRVTLSFFN